MSRHNAILAVLLFTSPVLAQEPAKPSDQPRVDRYGDPLPAGALRRFGTVRFRQEYVHDMAFTPDGKSLVVQGSDRIVQWDVATGKPLRTIPSQSSDRRSLGLSRDGRLVAACPDGDVVVFELSTGKELFRKGVGSSSSGGVISPDNSTIAIGSENGSALCDLQTGEEVEATRLPTRTSDLKYSPDGKWLGARIRHETSEDRIYLYDAKTGLNYGTINPIRPKDLESDAIVGYEFTPDGKSLIVSWQGSGIVIHDLKSEKAVHHIKTDAQFVALSSDGKILATSKERVVVLFSIETGKELRRWRVNDEMPQGTRGAFSPDGKTLALGFGCGIQLWDPEAGKRLDPFLEPIHAPGHIAVSDDAKTIAVNYGWRDEHYLLLLDGATLREKARVDVGPFPIGHQTFSPDGRRLAFIESRHGSSSHRVRLMDVTAGKEVTPEKKISGVFLHWKGSDAVVVTAEFAAPRVVFDAVSGAERERMPAPASTVIPMPFPWFPTEGRMVVMNDRAMDGAFFLAEWPSGKRIRPLVFPNTDEDGFGRRTVYGFSRDERLIFARDDWDEPTAFLEAATGRERFQIAPKTRNEMIYASSSPDGRLIIVGRGDKFELLDSLTFDPLMEIAPPSENRFGLALSANGKIMVTGGASTVTVWDLQAALRPRKTSPEKLGSAQLEVLWKELESEDARVGHRAMVTLYRRPDDAITFLKSRIPAPVDKATIRKLVRELDDDNFRTRDAAQIALEKMGAAAIAMVRQTLKDPPSPEAKRRLSVLAGKLTYPEEDRIRWLRCAELLERIGTPSARDTLELFRDVSDPEVADDATRSLKRLAASTR